MDFIELGGPLTTKGLAKMLDAAFSGPHGYTDSRLVEVPIALLIAEIAKLAEDRADWFPCGKWATIQAIQGRIEKELRMLFAKHSGLEKEGKSS